MNENSHVLSDDRVEDYVFGGKAVFSIKNTESGQHLTFSVKKHDEKNIYFVRAFAPKSIDPSLSAFYGLYGGGRHLWGYVGTVFADNGDRSFRRANTARHEPLNEKFYKGFEWLMANLDDLPENVEVWHEGRCARCGRSLTDPESIEIGIGPVCRGDRS